MKQMILGTAGHIDHGKTSLVKALTGTDTDRLKEEKLRGITIELGFASIDLPSGQHLGIVDVPGHEKFVKNMVAGASGIDLVAMVIAADEGVMPQTREHMEICTLLGVQHGMVVLTKIDMVEEEWLELVKDDIAQFTRDSFLQGAPIMAVSSVTGEGIPQLIEALDNLCREIPARESTGLFRLPVDRVFTMRGFGTVITGTLVSGKISVGEAVQIYPADITSKVRGLQVHGQSVETASAGLRTAINFQGLDREMVSRGDVLARPKSLTNTYMVDLETHFLNSNKKPIKNRTRVRFHTGTSEILGVLVLLDREELKPGESAVTQVRLDQPVALVRDDRYVLRSYSPIRTIGGGAVLNPVPSKHKRLKRTVVEGLGAIIQAAPADLILHHLREAGYGGVSHNHLLLMTNLPEKRLEQFMQEYLSKRLAVLADRDQRIYLHGDNFERFKEAFTAALQAYHGRHPLKPGMPKEELKSKYRTEMENKLFTLALAQLVKEGRIVQEGDIIHLANHKVSLAVDQQDLRKKILSAYRQSALMPPYFRELAKTLKVTPDQVQGVLQLLLREGHLIKVKEDLYYHHQVLEKLKTQLVAHIQEKGEISTPEFKDMTGASRKFVIPLLEYFDHTNLTIRVGDIRKLRKRL